MLALKQRKKIWHIIHSRGTFPNEDKTSFWHFFHFSFQNSRSHGRQNLANHIKIKELISAILQWLVFLQENIIYFYKPTSLIQIFNFMWTWSIWSFIGLTLKSYQDFITNFFLFLSTSTFVQASLFNLFHKIFLTRKSKRQSYKRNLVLIVKWVLNSFMLHYLNLDLTIVMIKNEVMLCQGI